jgi:chromosome segregation ATPase
VKFAQLQSKAQQFDFSKLFDALDELQDSIHERIDEETTSFNQDNVEYNTDKTFFSNQITEFTNEIATHEVDISDLTETKQSLEQTLQNKRAELEDAQKLKAGVERTMSDNERSHNAQVGEFNEAISAIDSALEVVAQVRDGTFLQKEQAERISIFLERKLSDLKHRRVMFAPLVAAFVQITDPSFADQDMITKVLRLLQDLRASLATSLQQVTDAYNAEHTENERILGEHKDRI